MTANALSLPPEIVCTILLYLVPYDPCGKDNKVNPLGWIASATHVCRKWRYIVLNFPQIWAENVCALPSSAATDCLLERAQSSPLAFRADGLTNRMNKHQMILAKDNLVRVQAFDAPWIDMLPSLLHGALGKNAWPNLTFLRFGDYDGSEFHDWRNFPVKHTLDAPALRELHLTSHFFSRVNAPQLRVLYVGNSVDISYGRSRAGIPEPLLIDTLRGMPLLERLTLDTAVARGNTDFTSLGEDTACAQLPHLRILRMRDEASSFGFYKFVHCAVGADVWVDNAWYNSGTVLPGTFAVLERHLRLPIYDMLLVYEGWRSMNPYIHVRLRASSSARAHLKDYEERGDDDHAEFRFGACGVQEGGGGPVNSVGLIRALARRINCTNIRFLDLGGIGEAFLHGDDAWAEVRVDEVRDALVMFPNVTTVQLSAKRGREFFRALRLPSTENDTHDDHGAHSSLELPLHRLQHLVVEGLHRHVYGHALASFILVEEVWKTLLNILEERMHAGCPVRFLTLVDEKKFPEESNKNKLADLDDYYTAWLRRAEKLVEKVVDVRGVGEPWDGRRLSEYVRKL